MKKSKLTGREVVMVFFLVVLLIGLGYYKLFYAPLQEELNSISNQCNQVDSEINTAMAKIGKMDTMQAELDEILSRPADEITEIAPYDNKEVVLSQLYGILGQAQSYTLNFTDPKVGDDGTVRRNISMTFRCANYQAAKAIIRDLTDSQWRCLVSNLSIVADDGNLTRNSVSVSATITYFEHTGLAE